MPNMEKILVPVDFSKASENALKYAMELAKITKSGLILLHSFSIPVLIDTVPVVMSLDDLEANSNQMLKELDQKIKKEEPTLTTDLIAKAGFVIDNILDVIQKHNVELVVMGMKGSTNAFDEFIGSNTTDLMKRTKCPVLVIPNDAKFIYPSSFVLACDHKKPLTPAIVKTIKYYSRLFGAKINILEVFKPQEAVTCENSVPAVLLDNSLTNYSHVSHLREGEDAAEELEKYITTYKPEWLIVVPREHSWLSSLFHHSFTKQMAYHTHLPLLSIHE